MSVNRQSDRAPRVSIAAIAALETFGQLNANNQALGSVRNVSRTGIGLETGQPPLCGQSVFLRISLDDEIHKVTARTTRVDRQGDSNFYVVGLDWSDCQTDQLAFLERVFEAAEELQD